MHRRIIMVILGVFALAACGLTPAGPGPTGALPSPAPQPTPGLPPSANPGLPPTGNRRDEGTAPQPTGPSAPQPPSPAASPAPSPSVSPAPAAAFKEGPCPFEAPRGVTVRCGTLTVPEDRAAPNGRTVGLPVAIYKSTGANPAPDPVIYLEGGPGGHAVRLSPFSYDTLIKPFLGDRDFILFDQRGAGLSRPAAECPELVQLDARELVQGLNTDSYLNETTQAALACRDRLAKEGVDLAAFTTAASAADLDDLRRALGYQEWNLYGISYGTRLALEAMRATPQGVRSVILDSTVPPQENMFTSVAASADRAFDALFQGCAADAACNSAFPDLKTAFYETARRLNEKPVTVKVTRYGRPIDVKLTGDQFIQTLFNSLYRSDLIPQLPKAIYDAREGKDYQFWGDQAVENVLQEQFVSYGMYFSVQCGEEGLTVTEEQLKNADAAFPQQDNVFDVGEVYEICQKWGAQRDDAANQPVTSAIPTLVLAGQYDPITPPAFGQEVAKTLPNSFFFEFPGLGHGATVGDPCPMQMAVAFLRDPKARPDSSCIAGLKSAPFVTR